MKPRNPNLPNKANTSKSSKPLKNNTNLSESSENSESFEDKENVSPKPAQKSKPINTLKENKAAEVNEKKRPIPFDKRAYTNTSNKKQKTSTVGLKMMRTKQDITVEVNGETVPYKTVVFVKGGVLSENEKEKFEQYIEKIPTNRPLAEIVEKSPITNSPQIVKTPSGKVNYNRVANFGSFSIFTPEPLKEQKTITTIDRNHDFFESDEYNQVKKVYTKTGTKEQIITVNKGLIKKTDAERKKDNYKRSISQGSVMAESGRTNEGSGNKYSHKAEIIPEHIPVEISHMIANELAGKITSQIGNFIYGTAHFNTNLIFIESKHRYLAKNLEEYTLRVSAGLVKVEGGEEEHLHNATTVTYTLETPNSDFKLPFTFDAQTQNKPDFAYDAYFTALVKAKVEALLEERKKSETKLQNNTSFKK